MTCKKQLRQRLLAQRQAMSTVTWQQKSDAICHYLQDSKVIGAARMILAYASFRQEPDLMPLWRSLLSQSQDQRSHPSPVTVGLPRCQGKTLVWHQWHPLESPALQPGAYGILEPAAHLPTIDPTRLGPQDVILVPAVGCDRYGYRLGYGGGFYDRLLGISPWKTMTTIGITFDFSLTDRLPIEPWDQPLTTICTESGLMIPTQDRS
ncbi:MAG: 5-formyltetrahydrofolate cyclo-ligase [Leptolyngbyaceae bacterium]|nr:5-formyltetrahydrofolate cyclo-ligase [Leptolyngbyaceae bacterium]